MSYIYSVECEDIEGDREADSELDHEAGGPVLSDHEYVFIRVGGQTREVLSLLLGGDRKPDQDR